MSRSTLVLPTAPGRAERVVRLPGPDGLSARGRLTATLLAVALLLVAVVALAAADQAPRTGARPLSSGASSVDPVTDSRASALAAAAAPAAQSGAVVPVDAIMAEWDGPTVHLDWAGRHYATAQASFVGDRVASPGDRVQRTLYLGNAGPSGAVLTVSLLLGEQIPAEAANPDLADDVQVFWQIGDMAGRESFAELLTAEQPVVAQLLVARGEEVAVTIGIEMPVGTQSSRNGAQESTLLDLQVLARMGGDASAADGGEQAGSGVTGPGALAVTGAQVAALLLAAVLVALVGWLLVAAARRRRPTCDGCGRRVGREGCAGHPSLTQDSGSLGGTSPKETGQQC